MCFYCDIVNEVVFCCIDKNMNDKLRRKIIYAVLVMVSAVMLAGCDLVPTLEMSEEQSNLIAEYAAGKLLEYAKGHPGGLMILEDVDRSDVNPGMQKEEEEVSELLPPLDGEPIPEMPSDDSADPLPDQGDTADVPDQDALVDTPEAISEAPSKPLEEALGISGATLAYGYYEVASTYPPNDTEIAFSMKAASGKELLILHFALSNPTDQDVEVHTDSDNFKVRLNLNGGERLRGDVTFLDNDLMNYSGVLTGGSSVDAVLVFEIPEGEEVSSMDLLIVVDGNEEKYNLM